MIEPNRQITIKSPYHAQLAEMIRIECIATMQWNPTIIFKFANNRFYCKTKTDSNETKINWRITLNNDNITIQCDERYVHLRKGFKIDMNNETIVIG